MDTESLGNTATTDETSQTENLPPLESSTQEIATESDDALPDIARLFDEPSSTTIPSFPERSRNSNRTMIRFIIVYEAAPTPPAQGDSDPIESISSLFDEDADSEENISSLFEEPAEQPRTPNMWRSQNNGRQLVLNLILNYPGPSQDDFQDVLNRLFTLHEPKGAPPTSQDCMERLHTITISEDDLETISDPTCTVCYEELQVGDTALELPCDHCFHKGCVSHWLKEHNTCPVCRFELPTDDQEYEKERVQRMADRRVDEAAYFGQGETF